MTKEPEPGSRGSNPLAWVLGLVVLLPVLYVFSTGPVSALLGVTGMDPEPIRKLYWPLIWLHDNTALKTPLEKWVDLWGGK
jgi:hypothetical protein